jgi:hypothetical protein
MFKCRPLPRTAIACWYRNVRDPVSYANKNNTQTYIFVYFNVQDFNIIGECKNSELKVAFPEFNLILSSLIFVVAPFMDSCVSTSPRSLRFCRLSYADFGLHSGNETWTRGWSALCTLFASRYVISTRCKLPVFPKQTQFKLRVGGLPKHVTDVTVLGVSEHGSVRTGKIKLKHVYCIHHWHPKPASFVSGSSALIQAMCVC